MKREYPTLYKKTATGAMQFWSIFVESSDEEKEGLITTTFGQVGTESPQSTTDKITTGKNTGKKNATNPFQQALKEAESTWNSKKKKGYTENLDCAANGRVDSTVITGGVFPMLAEKFSEQGHKISYPCYAQPKLDGARCIAVIVDGKASLWTRTRKPITSMPHIVAHLETIFSNHSSLILDGELYNHSVRNTDGFEELMSLIRKEEPKEGYQKIQYHVYDAIMENTPFSSRTKWIDRFIKTEGPLVKVETVVINNEDDVYEYFKKCIGLKYEGIMLRNSASEYKNRRSCDLQKVKEFDDKEFLVVGVKEGRGKLAGHAGSFVCQIDGTNLTFPAKLQGELKALKEFYECPDKAVGRLLKVKYQGYTADGIPRFPIGVCFRDSEDF